MGVCLRGQMFFVLEDFNSLRVYRGLALSARRNSKMRSQSIVTRCWQLYTGLDDETRETLDYDYIRLPTMSLIVETCGSFNVSQTLRRTSL